MELLVFAFGLDADSGGVGEFNYVLRRIIICDMTEQGFSHKTGEARKGGEVGSGGKIVFSLQIALTAMHDLGHIRSVEGDIIGGFVRNRRGV